MCYNHYDGFPLSSKIMSHVSVYIWMLSLYRLRECSLPLSYFRHYFWLWGYHFVTLLLTTMTQGDKEPDRERERENCWIVGRLWVVQYSIFYLHSICFPFCSDPCDFSLLPFSTQSRQAVSHECFTCFVSVFFWKESKGLFVVSSSLHCQRVSCVQFSLNGGLLQKGETQLDSMRGWTSQWSGKKREMLSRKEKTEKTEETEEVVKLPSREIPQLGEWKIHTLCGMFVLPFAWRLEWMNEWAVRKRSLRLTRVFKVV